MITNLPPFILLDKDTLVRVKNYGKDVEMIFKDKSKEVKLGMDSGTAYYLFSKLAKHAERWEQ